MGGVALRPHMPSRSPQLTILGFLGIVNLSLSLSSDDSDAAVCNVFACNCDCCQNGCVRSACGGVCAYPGRRRQRSLLTADAGDNDTYNSSSTAAASYDNAIEQCDDLAGFLDLLINSQEKLRMQISRYHCEVGSIDGGVTIGGYIRQGGSRWGEPGLPWRGAIN